MVSLTMNKKTTMIVILQTLLIIVLFWMLVFYGKDEYEEFQAEHEEEIEGLNRVTQHDGISTVTLSQATQQNSGIRTAQLSGSSYAGEIRSYGNIVGIDALVEAKTQYLNLLAENNLVKSGQAQNQAQYQRLKNLNADEKNVSDRAVQEASTLVKADESKLKAIQSQILNLRNSTRLKWGDELAKIAFDDNLPAQFKSLLERKSALVQVGLPPGTPTPKIGSSIKISPLNATSQVITAEYVSPATQSDINGYGKTFYYIAPADLLRIGMRVSIEADPNTNDAKQGVTIPNSAVVWHAGTAWVYFKQGKDQFIRKPISTDTEVEDGWFNQGIDPNNEIVVNGAQLLLSEEFKYLIKNENED